MGKRVASPFSIANYDTRNHLVACKAEKLISEIIHGT